MIEAIKNRKSVRKYKDMNVPDEKLMEIMHSARIAPSGSNTQPWKYIIVKSKETIKKLTEASNHQTWMETAPIHIVAVADIECRVKDDKSLSLDENTDIFELKQIIRDLAFSIEHILLEAVNQELDTCVVADFTQENIRPLLNIPKNKFVVAIITLGYAQTKYIEEHKRKDIEDIICYESWE